MFRKQYPAVYKHLSSHKTALSARNKSETGIRYEWYALQRWAANYHEEFAKEKLLWIDLTEQGRFAYDNQEMFGVNTTFMMTGSSVKYLCAVLNSTLITWYMQNTALNSGMGVTRWIGYTVERIPIPKLSAAKQRPFVRLVERILAEKATDAQADTGELEWDIDRLVYDLCGLTDEEDTVVERSLGLIHASDEEEDAALARIMEEYGGPYGPENLVSEETIRATLRAVDGNSVHGQI